MLGKSMAVAACAVLMAGAAVAQDDPRERRFSVVGEVAPRSASDIAGSRFSIGAETQDRDYSTYSYWRDYLGPLGVKHARLQSGWARTEPEPGRYDYGWIEPVIDDMRAQGVQPWLSLSYGNPAYADGGTRDRDSPLPQGEAREAWLRYVMATATRFRGRIQLYEIWNEPDLIEAIDGADFGLFAAATARAIRAADPQAKITIGGFALTGYRDGRPFIRDALTAFVGEVGPGYANAVTYHPYSPNPDTVYPDVEGFRTMVAAIDPSLEIRQGENGAPSVMQELYAASYIWWTEEAQAKWLLRRGLGDAARGIWTSLFTIVDLHYSAARESTTAFNRSDPGRANVRYGINTKGVLETRRYSEGPEDDRTVVRTKMGYRALQSLFAIFDDRLSPVQGVCTTSSPDVQAHGFRAEDGRVAVAAWRVTDRPGFRPHHENVDIRCEGLTFAGPTVYVDLLTSLVYRSDEVLGAGGGPVALSAVPVYDSPVVVIDEGLVGVW
jgi:hypothetical protein